MAYTALRDMDYMLSFTVRVHLCRGVLRYFLFEDQNDISYRHAMRRVMMPALLNHAPDLIREFVMARPRRASPVYQQVNRRNVMSVRERNPSCENLIGTD